MTITFCFERTHWHDDRPRTTALSRPRSGSHHTSSRHALCPSLACLRRRASALFWLSVHSCSTSSPSCSSKESLCPGGLVTSSRAASAIAHSFRSCNFLIVSSRIIAVLLLVEVVTTTDVLVHDDARSGVRLVERRAVQAALQDRLDALARGRSDRESTLARGLGTFVAILLGRADERHAGAVPLLGMRLVGQDALDHAAHASCGPLHVGKDPSASLRQGGVSTAFTVVRYRRPSHGHLLGADVFASRRQKAPTRPQPRCRIVWPTRCGRGSRGGRTSAGGRDAYPALPAGGLVAGGAASVAESSLSSAIRSRDRLRRGYNRRSFTRDLLFFPLRAAPGARRSATRSDGK